MKPKLAFEYMSYYLLVKLQANTYQCKKRFEYMSYYLLVKLNLDVTLVGQV